MIDETWKPVIEKGPLPPPMPRHRQQPKLWDGEEHKLHNLPMGAGLRVKPLGIPFRLMRPGDYVIVPISPKAPADLAEHELKLLRKFRMESSKWTRGKSQYSVRRGPDGVYRLVKLA